MTQPDPASPVPSREQPGERLDSWKDIAAYLKRDVSTVQRWEKRERMPVHRHLHDKLGSVYAFRSELDAWWRGRGGRLAEQEPSGPVRGIDTSSSRAENVRVWVGVAALGGSRGPCSRGFEQPLGIAAPGRRRQSGGLTICCVRARYLSVRTTNEDNQRVIELLEQAIALDPDFAAAYGELASAYVTRLAYVTPDESRELEQQAFAMAHKALSIDPNAPEGYIGRGDLLWTHRIDSPTKARFNNSVRHWR